MILNSLIRKKIIKLVNNRALNNNSVKIETYSALCTSTGLSLRRELSASLTAYPLSGIS